MINCSNCSGEKWEACSQLVDTEADTIRMAQAFDQLGLDEAEAMEDDPSKEVLVASVREAYLQDNTDLVDYRAEQLAVNLIGIGCALSEVQIKGKLLIKLAGN